MRAICSSRSQKKVRRTKRNMANRIVQKKCKKMGYLKNVAFLMDLLWLMPPPAYKVTYYWQLEYSSAGSCTTHVII
jgi:hypothetical protein